MTDYKSVPPQEKTIEQMTNDDIKAMANMLEWKGKKIIDCSKMELVKAVIHLTAQIVALNKRLTDMSVAKLSTKIARIP